MASGTFTLQLNKSNTPNTIINKIDAWGHIIIVPGDLNVNEFNDSTLLDASKYTGIVQSLELGDEELVTINGQGLIAYLGTGDTTGMPVATTGGPSGVRSYKNKSLEDVLDFTGSPKGLLRKENGNQGPIRKGTITEPTDNSTYTGKHYVESALKAIKFVCDDLDVEFKVDNKGYLSAGPIASLFNGHDNTPTAIIFRGASGEDPNIDGIATTSLIAQYDASEFVSSVELVASKYGAEANVGSASASSNPYKDLFGDTLSRVQYISDTSTEGGKKDDRATKYLNELNTLKKTLNVSLEEYDIAGDFSVGDKIFIFDPDIGFVDTEADRIEDGRSSLFETVYQGQIVNPTKIRILGLSWPIKEGYGVFYRDKDGNYTELTDYCVWEGGDVQLEIGDVAPTLGESLSMSGYSLDAVGSPDKSIPDQPLNSSGQVGINAVTGSYSDGNGISKAFIKVTWQQPNNTDGSTITDGSFYRIRWRVVQDSDGNNIIDSNDDQATEYVYSTVEFDTRQFIIYDLSPNTYYELGVQTVDLAGFDSAYSTISSFQTTADAGAPNKPDGFATIASNPLRVQFIHNLGQAKDDDGNAVSPVVDFTIAKDIDHLNIYGSTTQGFDLQYNSTTKKVAQSGFKLGELKATSSHIQNEIAAVGYIDLDNADTHYFRVTAVDTSGNESEPSDEQSGNADLIQSQNIANLAVTNALIANAAITDAKVANLSAGKITAGTISGQTIILDASGDTGNDSIIKSNNYSTGSAGWAINSDGSAEFQNATIRGSLHAADIDAGTISADRLDLSGKLNVGSAASDVNSGSTTIDGGKITADSITASQIASSTITTSQLNFTPYTDGENIDSGSIGGISIDSDSIHTSSYPSSGFEITSSGNANFLNVVARGTISGTIDTSLVTGSSGTFKSSSGTSRVETGGANPASLFFIKSSSTTGSIAAAADEFVIQSYTGDTLTLNAGVGQTDTLNLNSGTLAIKAGTDITTTSGTTITISGSSGNSGQVLKSNANGISWGNVTTTSNFSNNSNGISINNSNGIINLSFGNNSNNVSAGHNHPYGTSNLQLGNTSNTAKAGDHNHGGLHNSHNYFTNSDVDGNAHSHNQQYIPLSHVQNSINPHGITGNNHNHNNYLTNSQVDSKIAQHYLSYFSGHNTSDKRVKTDVVDTVLGLDFINRLQPRDFNWTDDYKNQLDSYDNDVAGRQKEVISNLQQGFIAQEVQTAVFEETGSNNAFSGVAIKNITDDEVSNYTDDDPYGKLNYENFVVPLVKAVQQLSAKIDLLQARVDELEGA